jgi:hypothetical protein
MSDEIKLVKRAFQEHLARVGVPITHGVLTRKCVTGAIERKRSQEVVAMLGEAATKVDMLVEDFDALGLVANQSAVTIDEIAFTVLTIERDPFDPCVHFLVVADH